MTHHVLHILGSAQVEGAATARLVATLARGVDPDRFALHAWFLDADGPLAGELNELGVRVRVVPWSRQVSDPGGAWAFAKALRAEHFSIVHQHIGGRLMSWLARTVTAAPLVRHLHSRVLEAHGVTPVALRVPRAAATIAVSEAVAQSVAGARPRVVYAGVPLPENDQLRSCNRADVSELVIGVACRLVPVKGLTHLVRAVALLKGEFPKLRLEVAGAGCEQIALEAQARSQGIGNHVTFVGWHRELAPLLARWDVFVAPSLDEGCGIAVLEAMAMGLPVVASAVGGLPEVVEEGRSGYLVPPADPQVLAKSLGILLRDPALRRVMGGAGRERVRRHFSADAMTAAVTAIYDEILATNTT